MKGVEVGSMKKNAKKIVNTKEMIKDNLVGLRGQLYDNLPSGKVDAFKLIQIIKTHIKHLDTLIEAIE